MKVLFLGAAIFCMAATLWEINQPEIHCIFIAMLLALCTASNFENYRKIK
jgi:hypothetical protein